LPISDMSELGAASIVAFLFWRVFVSRTLAMVVIALVLVAKDAPLAQAQSPGGTAAGRAALLTQANRLTAESEGEGEKATRINQWTIGLAGGQLEGTFSRFAAELAKAFDDGENLRILPVVTYGATENVSDLLYLKGIDLAITHADVFEEFKKKRNIGNIDKRINYIAPMFISEMYIIARPEIQTIADLEGKTVSLGIKGAGQTVTGPIVFSRLGVHPQLVFMNNSLAYEKMKSGEIAALVHSGGKPNDFITNMKVEPGFHLLEIPYSDKFADYYVPAIISSKDYPNFLKEGETVQTIGNSVVLAVYNWPVGTDHYRRVERFVEYFFERFDKLKGPTFHSKWKEINLAATVPGWIRYPVADRMLVKLAAEEKAKQRLAPATQPTAARQPGEADSVRQDITEEQRLFDEFMDWKKKARRN
jgi:TRAP-type uncharacterized transport system substrate-binding protein